MAYTCYVKRQMWVAGWHLQGKLDGICQCYQTRNFKVKKPLITKLYGLNDLDPNQNNS